MAKKATENWIQINSLRTARVHFMLIAAFVVSTVAADAWNLIPPGVVLQRWTIIGVVAAINTVIWYAARNTARNDFYYKSLIYTQIIADISVVSFLVYSQRGVDSLAVALYAIPLITSATLLIRSAIFATAALCASSYAVMLIRYQFLHPGESYKVELYSELLFYGITFFIMAALLQIIIRAKSR